MPVLVAATTMRSVARVCVTVLVTALLSCSAAAASSTPLSKLPSPPTSPSRPSDLFPAIASALRDLSVVNTDDIGYLTVAKRNLRFMLGAMVSPLQLLDWSHLTPQQQPSDDSIAASTVDEDNIAALQLEQMQYDLPHPTAPMSDVLGEDIDFAEHGDLSHILRVAVNAHDQRTAPRTSQRYTSSGEPSPVSPASASVADTSTSTDYYEPSQSVAHVMHTQQYGSDVAAYTGGPRVELASPRADGYNQAPDSSSSSVPALASSSSYSPFNPASSSSYNPYNPSASSSASANPYPPINPYSSSLAPPPPIIVDSSSSSSGAPYTPDYSSSSSSSSAPPPPPSDQCDALVHCGPGRAVNFTQYNTTLDRLCTRQLCVCPYDHTGRYCDYHYWYSCRPWLQADTQQRCAAVRNTPRATAYASHSDERPNTHIAASSSEYYTYESILSGPNPPCVTLDARTVQLSFIFTCDFWATDTAETWGDEQWWNRTVSDGWQQNGTLPTFEYAVHNVDAETNRTVFAIVAPYAPVLFEVRVHNTAHPSQYNSSVVSLWPANLQWSGTSTGEVQPVALPFELQSLPRNLKRGGRVLVGLSFAAAPWGLNSGSSGLPWQLTVEDGSWELPGPKKTVWLTAWQQAGVVLLVLVVAALLVWRWYQRRQTEKMQALLAEQRGKQHSWFERTE